MNLTYTLMVEQMYDLELLGQLSVSTSKAFIHFSLLIIGKYYTVPKLFLMPKSL